VFSVKSLINIGEEDTTDTSVSALSERICYMVYVLSNTGKPLMPTERHGKVAWLLKSGKAKVVRRTPFTIQLLYKTTEHTQPITLGVDPGYGNVGLSAVTEKREIFKAEARIRTDIPRLMETRRSYRRLRRNRKTRYRTPRFNNRVRTKRKGWLPPSVENRIGAHIRLIKIICSILPVCGIVIETAQFDTQKLKNPDIDGVEYQNGDQTGFWNVREYILWRDDHTCQHCKGKSGDPILQVHHLESRQTGSDRPGNLITLCKTCHEKYHKTGLALPEPSSGFKAPSQVTAMRWQLYERAKSVGLPVSLTYGYITKSRRKLNNMGKNHVNDAFVIAGGVDQQRFEGVYMFRQVRRQNRKLFKGIRSHIRNTAPRVLYGFRVWDKVRYKGREYFIKGRRTSGYFALSDIDGQTVVLDGKKLDSVKYTRLRLIAKGGGGFLSLINQGVSAANIL